MQLTAGAPQGVGTLRAGHTKRCKVLGGQPRFPTSDARCRGPASSVSRKCKRRYCRSARRRMCRQIWATQVLEGLAKNGVPSRAEVTDAAMGERPSASC